MFGMVKALFGTNILIDHLNAIGQAQAGLQPFADKAISLIAWMEVMVGTTREIDATIRGFLSLFVTIPVGNAIGQLAVA